MYLYKKTRSSETGICRSGTKSETCFILHRRKDQSGKTAADLFDVPEGLFYPIIDKKIINVIS